MNELYAALIGALLGGLATLGATWWHTRHESGQARAAAEEERQAARHSISRQAVVELLGVLAEVERAIPGIPHWPVVDTARELQLLRGAQVAQVALLPDAIQKRWAHLGILVGDLNVAEPVGPDNASRADWTEQKVDRACEDVAAYLAYMRRSLVALINEQDLPPDAAPPHLRRVDMAVWLAPDEGGPAA